MSEHLSDETLFAAAGQPDASVTAHLAGCEPCRVRARRLSAGASLLSAARSDTVPPVRWSAIDARVMAAAETAASDIRRGRLRPSRPFGTTLAAGLTLAAAAAGIFALRVSGSQPDARHVATTTATHVARPYAAHDVAPPAPAEALTGVVLMVAGSAEYVTPEGSAHPLEITTQVREGGRIRTREGGRAIVATQPGSRIDARGGSEIRLARFSTADVQVELSKGEARIEGGESSGGRTSLVASGWTVESKGGAFIAKLEGDTLRVRVVSGKIGLSQGEGESRDANAGEEVTVARGVPGVRVVSQRARDENELDASFLSSEGRVFALPSLPNATALRTANHGALPPGVSALRTAEPVTLTAESNGETWSLELSPAAPAPTSWGRASGTPVAVRGAVASSRVARVASANEPSATAPGEAATRVGPAPGAAATTAPGETEIAAEVISAGDREADRGAASRALAARSAVCFRECEATGSCGDTSGYVALDTESDGSVSSARVHGFTSATVAACVQHQAQLLRLPRTLRSQAVQLDVTRRGP